MTFRSCCRSKPHSLLRSPNSDGVPSHPTPGDAYGLQHQVTPPRPVSESASTIVSCIPSYPSQPIRHHTGLRPSRAVPTKHL